MGRSAASTPTPRGNTLDGQLRISFRKVLRNGSMGIDQCAFVGAHFGVDSATVRKSFSAIAPAGGTADEATFVEIMHHAIQQSQLSKSPSDRPRMINKNSAMLHKELSINPFVKLPIVLPRQFRETSDLTAVPTMSFDKLSPANSRRAKLPSRLMTPSIRLNRSADYGLDASNDMTSPVRERSQSVPLTARTEVSGADGFQKPGSAAYLRPYTPRSGSDLPTWKWNQLDNNVPKNIRNVLLKPMRLPSRPSTPPMKSPELKAILDRMRRAMKGITRIECIQALTKAGDGSKDALVSLEEAKNALQALGFLLTEHEVQLLAMQCKVLSADGKLVKAFELTNAIIPVASRLSVAEVGIDPEYFAKFKQQRLTFTHTYSTKEVKLLELLRSKLAETCHGGPGELRRAFKLIDTANTGRCDLKGMVLALELHGLGMSQADAEVLYLILDPSQRDGMDYNEFTSLMMPPDIAEAERQTVTLGYQRGVSLSRQGLRNRQTGGTEKSKVKSKPDPSEVSRFMHRLTAENVAQVLKNKVALALKAGPGAIRRWFALFDKDGNKEIDEVELKELLVDFGLNLSEAQVSSLMRNMDSNSNGLIDQAELIAALLPADQVYVCVKCVSKLPPCSKYAIQMHAVPM
jgi:Ca2+-binding EF-hand superfamily protein